ncbi:MAG TPA: MFS transporter [Trebonia sp.]|jgi:MFS family permease|nr:MFS transporter [Trebonia sp.]
MRQLLARRDARIYLTGQVFSLFGDSCLWLAMGVWVRTLTGSNAQAGLVFFFYTAASLLAPALGLLADRVRRRPLLLAVNTLTAAAVLALLAVHGSGQVWLIDAVMFAYGVSGQVIGPAQSALLTVMVPAELLPDANAALRTVQEGLRLVGPLTGAALFVVVGPHVVVVIDAATFAFPVASLLLLHVREPAPHPAEGRWARQVAAGVRHIWQVAELRQIVIAGACMATVFGFTETAIYAIVTNGLHRPAAFIGITSVAQGIGAIAAGFTAAPLVRRIGEGRLVGLAMLVAAAGVALMILPSLPPVIAGLALFGAAIPWLVVGLMTLAQRLTPPQLQGRVFAAVEVLITTPQTLSIALGAALITFAGYQVLLAAMAATFTATAVYVLTRPEQRHPRQATTPNHASSTPVPSTTSPNTPATTQ